VHPQLHGCSCRSSRLRFVQLVQHDRLHWAGCRGSPDLQALCTVGVGLEPQRFLAVQFEDIGREKEP
jgi:hypothetical protein